MNKQLCTLDAETDSMFNVTSRRELCKNLLPLSGTQKPKTPKLLKFRHVWAWDAPVSHYELCVGELGEGNAELGVRLEVEAHLPGV